MTIFEYVGAKEFPPLVRSAFQLATNAVPESSTEDSTSIARAAGFSGYDAVNAQRSKSVVTSDPRKLRTAFEAAPLEELESARDEVKSGLSSARDLFPLFAGTGDSPFQEFERKKRFPDAENPKDRGVVSD